MRIRDASSNADPSSEIVHHSLSVLLGIVTLVVFGVEKYLSKTAGQSLGDVSPFVMGFVVLVVGASAFHASLHGHGITTAVIVALGPIGGFFVYLIGYHLVFPPSTDSPTWLIFLAVASGFLATGIVPYLFGRLLDISV